MIAGRHGARDGTEADGAAGEVGFQLLEPLVTRGGVLFGGLESVAYVGGLAPRRYTGPAWGRKVPRTMASVEEVPGDQARWEDKDVVVN